MIKIRISNIFVVFSFLVFVFSSSFTETNQILLLEHARQKQNSLFGDGLLIFNFFFY